MLKPQSKKFVEGAIVLNSELHSLVHPVIDRPKSLNKIIKQRESKGLEALEGRIEARVPLLQELAVQLAEQDGNFGDHTFVYLGSAHLGRTRYEAYVRPLLDKVTGMPDLQYVVTHNGIEDPSEEKTKRRCIEYPVISYQSSDLYEKHLKLYDELSAEMLSALKEVPEDNPVSG